MVIVYNTIDASKSENKHVFLSPIFDIKDPLSKDPPKAPSNKQLENIPIIIKTILLI